MGTALYHRRQAPGDGPGQLPGCGAGRGAGAGHRVPQASEERHRPDRSAADRAGEHAHLHHVCRPVHPRAPARLEECQARPAVGAHAQDLRPTGVGLEAGGHHRHGGYFEGLGPGAAAPARILNPIWTTKTETAKRLQGRIENILDYAAAHQYRDSLNPARWRGHLDKLLPKPARVKQVTHHPAMAHTEVPAFMAELCGHGSVAALALRFLILTATRTSEVLQAQWQEIDREAAVWTVPADRMKTRREHRVPLCDAALRTLEALPRIEGNPYLFPGARPGRPLSNQALLYQMHGMGYGVHSERGHYVPHGFRSSFRDWSGEVSSFPRDVAEMALAHVIENKVEAAYRRGDLFAKRRKMMQEWAEYVGKPQAEIIPFGTHA